MAMGKASDFQIYHEQFYGGMYEELAQNVDIFNAASKNNIRLVPDFKIGEIRYDFHVLNYPLIIEVDGGIHNDNEKRKRDYRKDRLALKHGYRVIRFSNEEINNKMHEVYKEFMEVYENIGKIPKIYHYNVPEIKLKNIWRRCKDFILFLFVRL